MTGWRLCWTGNGDRCSICSQWISAHVRAWMFSQGTTTIKVVCVDCAEKL